MAATDIYLDQFIKTATKGNVTIHRAVLVNRVQLVCTKCDMTLTAKTPEGTNLDYSIQEFIKIHAHIGGHKDPVCTCGASKFLNAAHTANCPLYAVPPTPVTADFKKVPIGSGFHIDDNPAKAQIIQSQMAKYEEEQAKKDILKKIAALQEAGVAAKTANEWVELQKLKNILAIQEIKAKIKQAQKVEHHKIPDPPKERAKTLKQETGRKFR